MTRRARLAERLGAGRTDPAVSPNDHGYLAIHPEAFLVHASFHAWTRRSFVGHGRQRHVVRVLGPGSGSVSGRKGSAARGTTAGQSGPEAVPPQFTSSRSGFPRRTRPCPRDLPQRGEPDPRDPASRGKGSWPSVRLSRQARPSRPLASQVQADDRSRRWAKRARCAARFSSESASDFRAISVSSPDGGRRARMSSWCATCSSPSRM